MTKPFDAIKNLGTKGINCSIPLSVLVGLQQLPNVKYLFLDGRNPRIQNGTVCDVWPGVKASPSQESLHWPTEASHFSVYSTNPNDTFGSLTGVSVVLVRFINENWDFDHEYIKMNGTTPVLSTKKMIRHLETECIYTKAYPLTTTGEVQEGDIAVKHVDDDLLMDYIWKDTDNTDKPDMAKSSAAKVSCPRGYMGFFAFLTFSPVSNRGVDFYVMSRNNEKVTFDGEEFYQTKQLTGIVDELEAPKNYDIGNVMVPFKGKTDLWLSAFVSQNTPVSSVGVFFFIRNDFSFEETGEWV